MKYQRQLDLLGALCLGDEVAALVRGEAAQEGFQLVDDVYGGGDPAGELALLARELRYRRQVDQLYSAFGEPAPDAADEVVEADGRVVVPVASQGGAKSPAESSQVASAVAADADEHQPLGPVVCGRAWRLAGQ